MSAIEIQSKNVLEKHNSLDSATFNPHFEKAYSHGLEAIYALETVDVKTIRIFNFESPEKKHHIKANPIKQDGFFDQAQLEFELGENFRSWIEPFYLREPIQVLGLSKKIEGYLIGRGKTVLRDLIDSLDVGQQSPHKGLGHGLVEEIRNKFTDHVAGRSLSRSLHVEFASWLTTLTYGLERKKYALCLEEFGYDLVNTLSPGESFEIRRVDNATKQEWISETFSKLRTNERMCAVHKDMQNITQAFIIPWLHERNGLATELELSEMLQIIAEDSQEAISFLRFLSKVYYNSEFPFSEYLYKVENNVFCPNEFMALAYQEVVNLGLSYFYRPSIVYPLSQLKNLMLREFVKSWKDYSEDFIEGVLRRSGNFRVRKNSSGILDVRLS